MQLRDYQEEALMQLRGRMAAGLRRILLVAPTGSGKTVMAAEMIRGAVNRGNPVLFLAHRKELIEQTSAKLRAFGVAHGIIKSGYQAHPWQQVQVASVQTLDARHLKKGRPLPAARLIVVDEAHRTMGDTYMDIIASYPRERTLVIGLTATPVRLDGKGLGDMYEDLVEAARIEDLVSSGVLVKPRIFGAPGGGPDLRNVRTTAGDYNSKQLELVMNKAQLVGDIVKHWERYADNRITVVFATSIEHSLRIRDSFRAAGIECEHIDGNTNERERDHTLSKLRRGELRVVTNVGVLTEGWDLPECGVCVLARPTKSLSLFLQMAGRVLRSADGKPDAVILDHAGCVFNHGQPHWPREWELTPGKKKGEKAPPPVKQCPRCFAIVSSGVVTCDDCGHVFDGGAGAGGAQTELRVDDTQELVELTTDAPPTGPKLPKWLERLRPEKDPNRDDRVKAYDAIARKWVEDGEMGIERKVGWIAVKYRELFGSWPHPNVVKACSIQAVNEALEEAREVRRMERIAESYGYTEEAV